MLKNTKDIQQGDIMATHKFFETIFKRYDNMTDKILIEIGTTREIMKGHDSTSFLYKSSKKYNFRFITVDMDPENTINAKKRFKDIEAYTQKGEEFLKNFPEKIDFIYLDAFDYYHSGHSQKRKSSYAKNLGCEINNENCHKMHLECSKSLVEKLSKDGVIVFDDILNREFDGKGKTAIPFLLESGFIIETFYSRGCVLVRK